MGQTTSSRDPSWFVNFISLKNLKYKNMFLILGGEKLVENPKT